MNESRSTIRVMIGRRFWRAVAVWFLGLWLIMPMMSPALAQIYVYCDKDGVLHFTNTPTSARLPYKLYRSPRVRQTGHRQVATYGGPSDFDVLIENAAESFNLPFSLVKSIIKAESDFDANAVSKKGAKGLMQIMPENYRHLAIENPFDPRQNIMGGSRYIKHLLQRYDGKLPLALAAYNAGPKAVDRYGKIPPYKETRKYVERVLRYYRSFKQQKKTS